MGKLKDEATQRLIPQGGPLYKYRLLGNVKDAVTQLYKCRSLGKVKDSLTQRPIPQGGLLYKYRLLGKLKTKSFKDIAKRPQQRQDAQQLAGNVNEMVTLRLMSQGGPPVSYTHLTLPTNREV